MRTVILTGLLGFALGLAALKMPRALGPREFVDTAATERTARALTTAAAAVPGTSSGAPTVKPREKGAASSGDSVDPPEESDNDDPADEGTASDASNVADSAEARLERLIAAGFTRDRAKNVLSTESRLRRAALAAEYTATGTIRALNSVAPAATSQQLRTELGDDDYEKYLRAMNQPTRVGVGDVDPDSAAAHGGILPGDEILSYRDRRVFNLRDLNTLMLQTPEGETVGTTVMRDGQTLQLYVTGGPLGISQPALR